MKWTVEYRSVEAITVEADTEDEALKLAQESPHDRFTVVENSWGVFEGDEA